MADNHSSSVRLLTQYSCWIGDGATFRWQVFLVLLIFLLYSLSLLFISHVLIQTASHLTSLDARGRWRGMLCRGNNVCKGRRRDTYDESRVR